MRTIPDYGDVAQVAHWRRCARSTGSPTNCDTNDRAELPVARRIRAGRLHVIPKMENTEPMTPRKNDVTCLPVQRPFTPRFVVSVAIISTGLACAMAVAVSARAGAGNSLDPGAGHSSLEHCPVDFSRTLRERSKVLSIIRSMPDNSWQKVNENTFASVWMPKEWQPRCVSNVGPRGIIDAWGGFAYDSNRGDLLIFGGGHADYCGNDIYRFRLSTLRWERAGISSQMTRYQVSPTKQTAIPIDGLENAPATSHMYDQLTFLPVADRMIYFGGRPFWSGRDASPLGVALHPDTGPWLFDPSKAHPDRVVGTTGSAVQRSIQGARMWENRDYARRHPEAWVPGNYGSATTSSASVCSGGHDVVLLRASSGSGNVGSVLIRYDVPDVRNAAADHLTRVSASNNHMKQADLAVDPTRSIAVLTGDSAKRPLVVWDLESPSSSNAFQIITPLNVDGTWTYAPTYGMDFDAQRDRFLLWDGASSVWALVPPKGTRFSKNDWRLTRLVARGGPEGAPTRGGGANGKWKYAPDLDVFLGLRRGSDGDVWIYRPDEWKDPGLR